MAKCKGCGTELTIINKANDNHCIKCDVRLSMNTGSSASPTTGAASAASSARIADIEAVMLTTESAPNLQVKKRLEVVTAEVAYGMNIFKDLFASVRDIVGGRSEAVQKTMRDARRTALYELKKEAHSVGANAVIAVDLDYVELSGGAGANMVMLVASGTAVVIE